MASHVFAGPPTDAGLDSDLGNLEQHPKLVVLLKHFFFLIWGMATAIREHDGLLQSSGRWYLSK